MIVEDDIWQGIPIIHCYDNEKMNEYSPVLIFLHGFLSGKEHNLHYAYQLVKKGIRVILPDALLHGVRTDHLTEEKMNYKFWNIVVNSIHEVGILYDELMNRFSPNKIGIAGTSMGGIVTCGCLKKYDWINAAAVCMGAPAFNDLADYQVRQFEQTGVKLPLTDEQKEQIHNTLSEYDITKTPEKLNNRPVIFWHGKKDKTVPFENAYHFYTKIQPYYDRQEDWQFIVEENLGHKVNRAGMLAVTDFLIQRLKNE